MPTKLTNLALSSFGQVDGIVINHGILAPKRFADCTIEEWKQIYDINVFSGIALVSFVLGSEYPITKTPAHIISRPRRD